MRATTPRRPSRRRRPRSAPPSRRRPPLPPPLRRPSEPDRVSGSDLVLVGVFGAPHGVRGELRLKSFTEDPAAVGDYGPVQAEDGRRFAVTVVRALKDDMVVARVDGVADREAAAALTHLRLFVPRDRLPAPE